MRPATQLIAQTTIALLTSVVSLMSVAAPVTLDVSITHSTYRVTGDESASDLLAAHHAGAEICSVSVTELSRISSRSTCGGGNRDYSLMATATFNFAQAATYRFQLGTDWGRGGGVILEDLAAETMELATLRTDDIWWSNNWNHSDVIDTTFDLQAGLYRMTWVGFEGCCDGHSDLRFSVNESTFALVSEESVDPFVAPLALFASSDDEPSNVPAPLSSVLLLPVLLGLAARRQSRARA